MAMTPKVPTIESGSAILGITVAGRLRRKRKITSTTSPRVRARVNFTSATDSRIVTERSYSRLTLIDGGSCSMIWSTIAVTRSATSTVLEPGCRLTARVMVRTPLYQLPWRGLATASTTSPRSPNRTGEPFR